MRHSRRLCCALVSKDAPHALETPPVLKNYRQLEAQRKEEAEALKKYNMFKDMPLRYQLLEVLPGQGLPTTKLKYLLACRKHHPEVGGDPEMFLRVSLAYQDCMKDYGIETVDNKIVNLGNFQSCEHELKNYLQARAEITSYIPLSTLDDHINKLQEVQTRIGADLAEKLSDNSDEVFWLLEDIEKAVEMTGVKTVKIAVLEDGSMKVLPQTTEQLEGGEVKQTLIEESAGAADENNARNVGTKESTDDPTGQNPTPDKESNQGREQQHGEAVKAIIEKEVSVDDLATLNAKHNVQKREDVAGLAARVATGVMNNTKEKFQIRFESMVAAFIALNIGFLVMAYFDAYVRAKQQERKRPETKEHITTDTMLPWWGNDVEYEAQVKRIFVEEWRRARSSARRVQVFQDGVARESLPEQEKERMDVSIFNVTADKVRKMKEHADAQHGRQ